MAITVVIMSLFFALTCFPLEVFEIIGVALLYVSLACFGKCSFREIPAIDDTKSS